MEKFDEDSLHVILPVSSNFSAQQNYLVFGISKLCNIVSRVSPCCVLCRFHGSDSLVKEVTRLVRLNPESVCHIPDALQYLVTPHSLEAEAPEVSHDLVIGARSECLSLFCIIARFDEVCYAKKI